MTQQKHAAMVARPKMLRVFCALLYDTLTVSSLFLCFVSQQASFKLDVM